MTDSKKDHEPDVLSTPAVTLYWRPGCPYCVGLKIGLRGVALTNSLNIWQDPAAAAFVRSVNGGDELVPTVVVGETVLRNPSARDVKREIARQQSA